MEFRGGGGGARMRRMSLRERKENRKKTRPNSANTPIAANDASGFLVSLLF